MAMFGSDWFEETTAYDTPIGGFSRDEAYKSENWDKPIGAPIHDVDEYDSLREYEHSIRHFGYF